MCYRGLREDEPCLFFLDCLVGLVKNKRFLIFTEPRCSNSTLELPLLGLFGRVRRY